MQREAKERQWKTMDRRRLSRAADLPPMKVWPGMSSKVHEHGLPAITADPPPPSVSSLPLVSSCGET